MNIVIKPYRGLPCGAEVFTVNGIEAYINDFGSMEDVASDIAEPCSCGCMRFTPHNSKMEATIKKYNISAGEFEAIQELLEEKMYVGSCGCCV